MNKDLIAMLKYLRLGGLLAHWDDYLKLAAEKGFSHARHTVPRLRLLVARRDRSRRGRARSARAVLHPHAPAAQEKAHPHHFQPGFFRMGLLPQKRASDRRPNRSAY